MPQWPLLVYLFYGFATFFNYLAALSLPYGSAFIAEIQFNEHTFSGSLNGMSVRNLSMLHASVSLPPCFVKLEL